MRLADKRGIPLRSTLAGGTRLRPRTRVVVVPKQYKTQRHRVCADCKGNPYTCPMLLDVVWLSIATKQTLLCFECTEIRLGREIVAQDFNHAPINYAFHKLRARELEA